jgi:hypothetical protein
MTRIRLIVLSAVALVGLMPAPVVGQPEFEGIYIARGIDLDGIQYHRAVEIEREGDRFVVIWMSPQIVAETLRLELTSIGVGIASGNVLAVSYSVGLSVGVIVYEFSQDGQELVGRWTVEGDDAEIRSEILVRVPEPDFEPGAADGPPGQGLPRLHQSPVARPIVAPL